MGQCGLQLERGTGDRIVAVQRSQVIGRPIRPLALERLLAALEESPRQAASRCASTSSSRDSASSGSPH
jgi:hypothetical protein